MTNPIRQSSNSERAIPAVAEIEPNTTPVTDPVAPQHPDAGAPRAPQPWSRRKDLNGAAPVGTSAHGAAHFRFVRNDLSEVIGHGPYPEPHCAPAEREAWKARIQELRGYAAEDGEPFNEESESDLWAFLRSNPSVRKNALVLVPNGNLRAVWRRDSGAHIGAEFRGGGVVQYVIFRRRPDAERISRAAGRDDFEGFKRQTEAFDLDALLYE